MDCAYQVDINIKIKNTKPFSIDEKIILTSMMYNLKNALFLILVSLKQTHHNQLTLKQIYLKCNCYVSIQFEMAVAIKCRNKNHCSIISPLYSPEKDNKPHVFYSIT